ncbi:unnamed protein product [Darwinula stevensoni]|uniref:HP domain-containing protein n=1 Tax=Darwinula stevensoni TaxID=69355 RepID=A0A7R9FQG4_9CRUS|nr:unnamed protein product [Darwinula stevensoni]CAG0899690.1 unnamed protein product [Darwinula stevensoni]
MAIAGSRYLGGTFAFEGLKVATGGRGSDEDHGEIRSSLQTPSIVRRIQDSIAIFDTSVADRDAQKEISLRSVPLRKPDIPSVLLPDVKIPGRGNYMEQNDALKPLFLRSAEVQSRNHPPFATGSPNQGSYLQSNIRLRGVGDMSHSHSITSARSRPFMSKIPRPVHAKGPIMDHTVKEVPELSKDLSLQDAYVIPIQSIHGILKKPVRPDDSGGSFSDVCDVKKDEVKQNTKRRGSSGDALISSESLHSILKKSSEVEFGEANNSGLLQSILKKKSFSGPDLSKSSSIEPKPILKKGDDTHHVIHEPVKPILKKKSYDADDADEKLKSILKVKDTGSDGSDVQELKSILKNPYPCRSSDTNVKKDSISSSSFSSSESTEELNLKDVESSSSKLVFSSPIVLATSNHTKTSARGKSGSAGGKSSEIAEELDSRAPQHIENPHLSKVVFSSPVIMAAPDHLKISAKTKSENVEVTWHHCTSSEQEAPTTSASTPSKDIPPCTSANVATSSSPKLEAEPASSDEFDPVHLNVASKARLFMQLSKNNTPDSKKRCVRRKTLPVTSAEVREARANIVQKHDKESDIPVQQDLPPSVSNDCSTTYKKISIVEEKKKLFQQHTAISIENSSGTSLPPRPKKRSKSFLDHRVEMLDKKSSSTTITECSMSVTEVRQAMQQAASGIPKRWSSNGSISVLADQEDENMKSEEEKTSSSSLSASSASLQEPELSCDATDQDNLLSNETDHIDGIPKHLLGSSLAPPESERSQASKQEKSISRSPSPSSSVSHPSSVESPKDVSKGIQERLLNLKTYGETHWRAKVVDETVITAKGDARPKSAFVHPEEPPEKKPGNTRLKRGRAQRPRSIGISEILQSLQSASEQWKDRVDEKDAVKFTVAGKMGKDLDELPLSSKENVAKVKPPEPIALPFKLDKGLTKQGPFGSSVTMAETETKRADAKEEQVAVHVPELEDEFFRGFFRSVSQEGNTGHFAPDPMVQFSERDFQSISCLRVEKRVLRVQRRSAGPRNPLRSLAARSDIQSEYFETKSASEEKHVVTPASGVTSVSSTSAITVTSKVTGVVQTNFAASALAGLASKENFASVRLRKTTDGKNNNSPHWPCPDSSVLLLQVKGRKFVQTRLVKPCLQSLNQGDCYILVSSEKVFLLLGKYSNVIERTKALKVASTIVDKREYGLGVNAKFIKIDMEKGGQGRQLDEFYRALEPDNPHSPHPISQAEDPEEDAKYEMAVIHTNRIYSVEEEGRLEPIPSACGHVPKVEILQDTKALLFDFGSELYLWLGKKVPWKIRNSAADVILEVWKRGYSYEGCDVNPLNPSSGVVMHPEESSERPSWTIHVKINQDMEPLLFREKFLNWSDPSQLIHFRRDDSTPSNEQMCNGEPALDLKPCDVSQMLKDEPFHPDAQLNKILGLEMEEMHPESKGQFHMGDAYIIRWNYRVIQIVELDLEQGPHVRVVQGKEPLAFIRLFDGRMVIYKGLREEEEPSDAKERRLFIVQGNGEEESLLVEVDCTIGQLRSRGVFLLFHLTKNTVYVWFGRKALPIIKEIGQNIAASLKNSPPAESGLSWNPEVVFVEEGHEPRSFFEVLGSSNRRKYLSLQDSILMCDFTPRLFHLSSESGSFLSIRLRSTFCNPEVPSPFPHYRQELYNVLQPALFLLDNEYDVWLWQGEALEETCSTQESRQSRWEQSKKCALETALNYSREKNPSNPPPAHLVMAGEEPLEFVNLFPDWVLPENTRGKKSSVAELLSQIITTTYSLDVLKQRPLPDGVEATRLEAFLSGQDFKELFGMKMEEFYQEPPWKQIKLKKKLGLF